jgi:hypothetical protein
MLPTALVIGCCVLLASAPAVPARAQVRHCVTPDGQDAYTDRRCADIGAIERQPRPNEGAMVAMRLYRGGCARTLQDLVFELTTAVDGRDVNRLAALYHWPGMSTSTANATMQQLEAIVQRPLMDIATVVPPGPDGEDGSYYPRTTMAQAPIGVRLQQTLGNGTTPSQTVFGLQRHLGCWWVRL